MQICFNIYDQFTVQEQGKNLLAPYAKPKYLFNHKFGNLCLDVVQKILTMIRNTIVNIKKNTFLNTFQHYLLLLIPQDEWTSQSFQKNSEIKSHNHLELSITQHCTAYIAQEISLQAIHID